MEPAKRTPEQKKLATGRRPRQGDVGRDRGRAAAGRPGRSGPGCGEQATRAGSPTAAAAGPGLDRRRGRRRRGSATSSSAATPARRGARRARLSARAWFSGRLTPAGVAARAASTWRSWLTRPDHPLTARVIVNRLWQHHFGRGLVATPNDFGARGEAADPPRIARLAGRRTGRTRLVAQAHSSADGAEQRLPAGLAGPADADGKRIDPDNRLLWRMNRRRLDAEALRDGVLAVAGTLNPASAGRWSGRRWSRRSTT